MSATYDAAMVRLQRVLAGIGRIDQPTRVRHDKVGESLNVKATVVDTDRGTLTVVVSTEDVDRSGDITLSSAMLDAFEQWAARGKPVPLHWSHGSGPHDIIGSLDPATAVAHKGRVLVSGRLDLSSPVAREARRAARAGLLGASFGYLVPENGSFKREDGVRVLTKIDLFECSLCTGPVNPHTAVEAKALADRFAAQRQRALAAVDQIEARMQRDRHHEALRDFSRKMTEPEAKGWDLHTVDAFRHVADLEDQMLEEAERRSWRRIVDKHNLRHG